MTEKSLKIRTDFLKSLGIIKPCPCDYDFIGPIPDNQLLKSLVKRGLENKAGIGVLMVRYNIERHTVKDAKRACNKMAEKLTADQSGNTLK